MTATLHMSAQQVAKIWSRRLLSLCIIIPLYTYIWLGLLLNHTVVRSVHRRLYEALKNALMDLASIQTQLALLLLSKQTVRFKFSGATPSAEESAFFLSNHECYLDASCLVMAQRHFGLNASVFVTRGDMGSIPIWGWVRGVAVN